MASPERQYTDEIHGKFSYWATWLPNERIRLGDCGPVRDRVFRPEAHLSDFGVEFETVRGTDPLDLEHKSEGSTGLTLQASAGTQVIPQIPPGKAGIEISFARENGVAFAVRQGLAHRIKDIRALKSALLGLVQDGELPREYAVVTHVVEADTSSVVIGSARSAQFVASAEVDLKAGLLDLANVKANLTPVIEQGLATKMLSQRGATPLFRLVGFKKAGVFWGSPRIEALGFEDDPDPGELTEVEPVDTDPDEG